MSEKIKMLKKFKKLNIGDLVTACIKYDNGTYTVTGRVNKGEHSWSQDIFVGTVLLGMWYSAKKQYVPFIEIVSLTVLEKAKK